MKQEKILSLARLSLALFHPFPPSSLPPCSEIQRSGKKAPPSSFRQIQLSNPSGSQVNRITDPDVILHQFQMSAFMAQAAEAKREEGEREEEFGGDSWPSGKGWKSGHLSVNGLAGLC